MVNSAIGRAALVLLGVLTVGACTPSTSVSTIPSPSASLASSPTPSVDLSGTKKDAADKVVAYRALIDELRQQTTPDVTRLLTVSTGKAYEQWRLTLQDDFKNGHRQVGKSVVTILATGSGTLANQWSVTACVDFSGADIVDKSGASVRTDSQVRFLTIYLVDQRPADQKWYVSNEESTEPC